MTRDEATRFAVDLRFALLELFPRGHRDWIVGVQARFDETRPRGELNPLLEIELRSPESSARLEIEIDAATRVSDVVDRVFDETLKLDLGDLTIFDFDRC